MAKRYVLPFLVWCALSGPSGLAAGRPRAEGPGPAAVSAQNSQGNNQVLRVDVNLVLLNVAVTDNKGRYVTGLRPSDFEILEDNVPQKISTFGEGNGPQLPVDALAG